MRAYRQGSGARVACSADDVRAFRRTWPGSGLHGAVSFTFEHNGDLVDVSTSYDGRDIAALSQDAQTYAETRGALPATWYVVLDTYPAPRVWRRMYYVVHTYGPVAARVAAVAAFRAAHVLGRVQRGGAQASRRVWAGTVVADYVTVTP